MGKFDLAGLFTGPTLTQRLASRGIRPDLVEAAGRTASDIRLDRPIAALDGQLAADETVAAMALGRHRKVVGLVVVTDRRVLFQPAGAPMTIIDLPRHEVRAQAHKSRLVLRTNDQVLDFDRFLGRSAAIVATALTTSEPSP